MSSNCFWNLLAKGPSGNLINASLKHRETVNKVPCRTKMKKGNFKEKEVERSTLGQLQSAKYGTTVTSYIWDYGRECWPWRQWPEIWLRFDQILEPVSSSSPWSPPKNWEYINLWNPIAKCQCYVLITLKRTCEVQSLQCMFSKRWTVSPRRQHPDPPDPPDPTRLSRHGGGSGTCAGSLFPIALFLRHT